MTAVSYIREELARGVAYVILPVNLAKEISMDLTDYQRGWFDAIKRVWEMCESLELKYGQAAGPAMTELPTMLLEIKLPPESKGG